MVDVVREKAPDYVAHDYREVAFGMSEAEMQLRGADLRTLVRLALTEEQRLAEHPVHEGDVRHDVQHTFGVEIPLVLGMQIGIGLDEWHRISMDGSNNGPRIYGTLPSYKERTDAPLFTQFNSVVIVDPMSDGPDNRGYLRIHYEHFDSVGLAYRKEISRAGNVTMPLVYMSISVEEDQLIGIRAAKKAAESNRRVLTHGTDVYDPEWVACPQPHPSSAVAARRLNSGTNSPAYLINFARAAAIEGLPTYSVTHTRSSGLFGVEEETVQRPLFPPQAMVPVRPDIVIPKGFQTTVGANQAIISLQESREYGKRTITAPSDLIYR